MQRFLRDLLPGAALSLAGCLLIAVYGPLELFFTNYDEFMFGFPVLFPVLLKLFLVGLAVCLAVFAISYGLYRRLYDVLLCLGAVAFLCTYIQGMFLVGDLPPLDGTRIEWSQYRGQDALSLLIWLVVGVGFVLLARFLGRRWIYRIVTGLSLFLTAVLLVTGITVGLQAHGFGPRPKTLMTTEGQMTLSTDENLVILVMDATDSKTFYDMLHSTDPEFGDILEDFTYYPNTVCAYPFTKCAIPNILHGQWFENQEDYQDFTARAMASSPLLQRLRQEDYRVGIYEEESYMVSGKTLTGVENTLEFTFQLTGWKQTAKEEMKLVWFKYAPWPLKRLVTIDKDRFNRILKLPEGIEQFHDENREFYEMLSSQPVETVPEKCFRFYHLEGAHVPFRYDRDVNLISDGTYEENMQATMTIVSAYLEGLRAAGVYDNTAVILMADHGYAYGREREMLGRCAPILAVKGIGEKHPLEISEAPISYEDLQTLYSRLMDGMTGEKLFDARPGDQRDRRVLMYYYKQPDYMAEYIQHGHAFDETALEPTGVIYER